jgi:hypothetical protein
VGPSFHVNRHHDAFQAPESELIVPSPATNVHDRDPNHAVSIVSAAAREHITAAILALVCFGFAFVPVRNAVIGVTAPFDIDQFRDIAAAQSMADGNFLEDPFYKGESLWYNPLLAAATASVSKLTSLSVPRVYVQQGPFISAIVAAAFYLMAASLFGPWPAVIAFSLFLFSPSYTTPWATPSLSPWVFTGTFASGFFYAGIALCSSAMSDGRQRRWMLAGFAIGLTFLSHTAPAFILTACVFTGILWAHRRRLDRYRIAAAVLAIALATSVPFLLSIVGHYHLHVVNRAPSGWIAPDLQASSASSLLLSGLTVQNGLSVAGFLILIVGRQFRSGRILVVWTLAAIVMFYYGWVQQLAPNVLPSLVPQFHFNFYLKAASYVLAGVGVWTLLQTSVRITKPGRVTFPLSRSHAYQPAMLAVVLVAGISLSWIGLFRNRHDFTSDRDRALAWTDEFAADGILERVRTETPPSATILATPLDSIYRVAPAGRRVVAVPREFSNPYVDYDRRADAQSRMLAAFRNADFESFSTLAEDYDVTHVLLGPDDSVVINRRDFPESVQLVFSRAGYTLLSVNTVSRRQH